MSSLKETLRQKIEEHRPRTSRLLKEASDVKLGEVTIGQAIGAGRHGLEQGGCVFLGGGGIQFHGIESGQTLAHEVVVGHVPDDVVAERDPAAIERMAKACLDWRNVIHVLFNNAAIAERREFEKTLEALVKGGKVLRVKELHFDPDAVARLRDRLVAFLEEKKEIAVPEFKDLAGGISRKHVIPLLEHFDLSKVTLRIGDKRVLRG